MIEWEEIAVALGVLALVIGLAWWAIDADDREMTAKHAAFYSECLKDRRQYDCDMQWATFKAAHDAEMTSAVAVGIAAGSAGSRR